MSLDIHELERLKQVVADAFAAYTRNRKMLYQLINAEIERQNAKAGPLYRHALTHLPAGQEKDQILKLLSEPQATPGEPQAETDRWARIKAVAERKMSVHAGFVSNDDAIEKHRALNEAVAMIEELHRLRVIDDETRAKALEDQWDPNSLVGRTVENRVSGTRYVAGGSRPEDSKVLIYGIWYDEASFNNKWKVVD